jgi:predicted DNA-binding transcriptional regulator AlpA
MNYSQEFNHFSYTAPAFVSPVQKTTEQSAVYDVEKYPESSNNVMCHQEVLDFFNKKRTTIITWRKTRSFPEPISKCPLRWLRSSVMEWVEHEGGFKAG